MPMIKFFAEAFGILTISLVVLFITVGLLCIFRVAYLTVWISRNETPQLKYFNGPWLTRIFLIIVSIIWSSAEITRLSFLNARVSYNMPWQTNICKIYLCSLGFSEPCIFLTILSLLHVSKVEPGALSRWWNRKAIALVVLCSLPILVMQIIVIESRQEALSQDMNDRETAEYLTRTSFAVEQSTICTYPLLSTVALGLLYILVICFVLCVGMRLLSSVINKHLWNRLYVLLSSLILCVSIRALLLGFSVLPQPGNLAYEVVVFLAFLSMFTCIVICNVVLVYFPVRDSMALRAELVDYHDDISLAGYSRNAGEP